MMENKFASPTADSTFKLIFGEEKHKKLTIDFLNDFLERTGDRSIVNIEFMQQEQTARRIGDLKSILDISCKDDAGNRFIIEIQRKKEHFFDMRALYYASSLLSCQLNETDSYKSLQPVIIIGILNFILYKTSPDAISHHLICDMNTGKQSINLIELHFIELLKFKKTVDELFSHIDKWIFFIKNAQTLEAIPKVYDDTPSIKKAFHLMERANWTKKQFEQYERDVRELQREITQELEETAERSETFEKGIEKGIEQGIEKGIEQGMQQVKEAMAMKLLKKNIPVTEIAELTELSMQQVKDLQNLIK